MTKDTNRCGHVHFTASEMSTLRRVFFQLVDAHPHNALQVSHRAIRKILYNDSLRHTPNQVRLLLDPSLVFRAKPAHSITILHILNHTHIYKLHCDCIDVSHTRHISFMQCTTYAKKKNTTTWRMHSAMEIKPPHTLLSSREKTPFT